MRLFSAIVGILCLFVPAQPARAQSQSAPLVTGCLTIDETRDTLSASDRVAARLLVLREFDRAGAKVLMGECAPQYTLTHVRIGRSISVTLSGPGGRRDGVAIGLDDLPALYSQMVRSVVSGRPMDSPGIVDRTNVTMVQSSPRRVQSDSFGYARLGIAGMFGAPGANGATAVGVGYRAELDDFALDVSFFNSQMRSSNGGYSAGVYSSDRSMSGSLLKLEALRFLRPKDDRSAYLGGGVSWGLLDVASGSTPGTYTQGSGLQGELTLGYEVARASTLRLFVQTDAVLPFYRATTQTTTYTRTGPATSSVTSHYVTSISISVGIGWQRGRR